MVALCTCILIGWVLKPDMVINEVGKNGETMGRKRLFVIMLKYIAPLFLLLLLMQTTGVLQLVVQ
jgi:NSS family neurotransmitter:Na+ symporter